MTDSTVTENWKPVPGYEGYYEVSNRGRVRSLDRVVTTKIGSSLRVRGRMLKLYEGNHGYHVVVLNRDGASDPRTVHRMVLSTFTGEDPQELNCCHNNGIRTDNRLENLRWDTPSENNYDIVRHGRHGMASKTHCKNGHEFNEENTRIYGNGWRRCIPCQKAVEAEAYRQRKMKHIRTRE